MSLATVAGSASAMDAPALTPPPPSSANCTTNPQGSICSWSETFKTPFAVPYGVTCDGFTVKVNLAGERQVTAFYNATGALDRRVRHATFSGTLSNSVTGASVPHLGHFTITDDFAAGTSTITGMLSRTVVAGEGQIWRNIGRIVTSMQGGAVVFEAGEHGTWDVASDPAIANDLCNALA